jgi:hypothetical protein
MPEQGLKQGPELGIGHLDVLDPMDEEINPEWNLDMDPADVENNPEWNLGSPEMDPADAENNPEWNQSLRVMWKL